MKILFICKHNKFRSKVAEAIFNKLNKNKKINAESAGLTGSEHSTPENVLKVLKEKDYDFVNRIARKVDSTMINDYDLLVIVADNVSKEFFKDSFKGRIIKWEISDCSENDIEGIRKRIEEIEEKVKRLVGELLI